MLMESLVLAVDDREVKQVVASVASSPEFVVRGLRFEQGWYMQSFAYPALRRSFSRRFDYPILHRPGSEPPLDQPQDPRIPYPRPQHPYQPIVVDVVEISSDVCLEYVSYILCHDAFA